MPVEVGFDGIRQLPVGGEVLQIDKLAVLAPQLLIMAIVLIPIAVLLYRKPWILGRLLTRILR
jgi:hypothetical protein